jgi:hypothetical protein
MYCLAKKLNHKMLSLFQIDKIIFSNGNMSSATRIVDNIPYRSCQTFKTLSALVKSPKT